MNCTDSALRYEACGFNFNALLWQCHHNEIQRISIHSFRGNSWHRQFMTTQLSIHQAGTIMKENKLIDLSKQFAVDIVNMCSTIKKSGRGNILLNQLLRSGTSIGANIHEANYAISKADFINKFQIALKECYESIYWLELFKNTEMISADVYEDMFSKCSKIRILLIASLTTAKKS